MYQTSNIINKYVSCIMLVSFTKPLASQVRRGTCLVSRIMYLVSCRQPSSPCAHPRFHGHQPNEPVNYCMVCEEEVCTL